MSIFGPRSEENNFPMLPLPTEHYSKAPLSAVEPVARAEGSARKGSAFRFLEVDALQQLHEASLFPRA